jgi:tetratricopeptide (TPR) repeat protein
VKLSCQDLETRLVDYVYDELEPAERQQVDLHLEGCGGCQDVLAGLGGTRRIMAALPEAEPSRGDDFILQAAAREARARSEREARKGGLLSRLGRWISGHPGMVAATMAGMILLAVVGINVGEEIRNMFGASADALAGAETAMAPEEPAPPPRRDRTDFESRLEEAAPRTEARDGDVLREPPAAVEDGVAGEVFAGLPEDRRAAEAERRADEADHRAPPAGRASRPPARTASPRPAPPPAAVGGAPAEPPMARSRAPASPPPPPREARADRDDRAEAQAAPPPPAQAPDRSPAEPEPTADYDAAPLADAASGRAPGAGATPLAAESAVSDEAPRRRAVMRQQQAARGAARARQARQERAAAYEEAEAEDDYDPMDDVLARGRRLVAQGQCEEAVALLEGFGPARAEDLAEAHVLRARCLERLGREAEAQAAYRSAVAASPGGRSARAARRALRDAEEAVEASAAPASEE